MRSDRMTLALDAGKGRGTLGDECVDALTTVRARGAGADGQGLAAQGALCPGRGDLAEQSFGGDQVRCVTRRAIGREGAPPT